MMINKGLLFLCIILLIGCGDDASKRILSEEERVELLKEKEALKLKNEAKIQQELLDWELNEKEEKNRGQNYYLLPKEVLWEDAGRFQTWGERSNAILDTKTGDVYVLKEATGEKTEYRWRRLVEFAPMN